MKIAYVAGVVATLSVALLSGCATVSPAAMQQKRTEFEQTIPTCSEEKECNAKWEAAQLWVVHHAGFKIQTATNVLIETYNATGGSPSIAVRVTKEPLGGGKYKLVVFVTCDNIFGCVPDSWDAALDFNRTVGAVQP